MTSPQVSAVRAPKPQARQLRTWVKGSLASIAILAIILLAPPAKPLITVTHDLAGWSLRSRPLSDILRQGLSQSIAVFQDTQFDTSQFGSDTALCAIEAGASFGPLTFTRLYNWNTPGDRRSDAAGRKQACEAQRAQLAATPRTLAAALRSGSTTDTERHLQDALSRRGPLAVTLREVGQPMRDKLADLMLVDPRADFPLSRLDVALAVGDKGLASQWLRASPPDTVTDYERYGFYALGLADDISRHAPDHDEPTPGFWGRTADDKGQQADGFSRSDFVLANAHCDAGYAKFLQDKGITADDKTVISAFLMRLTQEASKALGHLNLDYPYQSLMAQGNRAGKAGPKACIALAERYRAVDLSNKAIDTLGYLTGVEMMARYQAYARQEMHGQSFETRAAEDAFYDHLVFDQKTVPLPSLPLMFAALFTDRPSGAAACAALSALPKFMNHDAAMQAFTTLAGSWKGRAMPGMDTLTSCTPGLVFPPSLIPQETRDRNALLHQAGLECTVATPKQRYVYAQEVTCRHDKH